MRILTKKCFLTLLFIFSLFTIAGCATKIDYSLDVSIKSNSIYVGEELTYTVNLLPDNKSISDYLYSSSDSKVLIVDEGKITGKSAGKATITISTTYEKQELKFNLEIEVKEEPIEYSLNCIPEKDTIEVGETINVIVKELIDDQVLTNFDVFVKDDKICQFVEGKLKGLSVGTTEVTISVTYKNQVISDKFDITVYEKKQYKLSATPQVNTLEIGDFTTIVVKETTENVEVTDYTVKTSNNNVCIFEEGKIKAIGYGTATITVSATYSDNTLTASFVITVTGSVGEYNVVTSIPENLFAGDFIDDVTLMLTPGNISVNDFTIESSDKNIFNFDNKFKMAEAVSDGEVTITIIVKYEGNTYSFTKVITIFKALSLDIECPDSVIVGDTINLDVKLLPLNIDVTEFVVSTLDADLIEVENNTCKAIAIGKGKIAVKTTYNNVIVSKVVEVSIAKYVKPEILIGLNNYIFLNETQDVVLTYSITGETITDVLVNSSNDNIIEYKDGRIIAKSIGECELTFEKTIDDKTLTSTIKIEVYNIEGIELSVNKTNLYVNEIVKYTVKALPSNIEMNNTVFSSSDNNKLLVNSNACLALMTGKATINVSYNYLNNNYTDSVEINIETLEYPCERITISGSNGVLVGTSIQLSVSKFPSVCSATIKYSSNDESIATVSNTGLVNGIKEGKCIITATIAEDANVNAVIGITVVGTKEKTLVGGGEYYEGAIINYNELMNGVVQTTYLGYSTTQTPNIDVDGYAGIEGIIENGKFYPQQVNVISVPSRLDTKVIPWANLGGHVWSLTTVKGLIENYESMHPGYKVIAAVNGDFFDINANGNLPYQTTGENISDGEFYKTTNSFGDDGGTIGFTNNGSNVTLIGSHDAQRTQYMVLAIYDDNDTIIKEFDVQNLNVNPQDNQTSVFFGTYNSDKNYVNQLVNTDCYVVEKAELALPNNPTDFYGLGTITSKTNNFDLGVGQFAISTTNEELKNYLNNGVKIRVQYEYTGEFADVTSSTGFNAVVYEDINNVNITNGNILNRAPRTVIGMRADGTLVMMVVDGRQGDKDMYGADGYELAAMMKAYGCVNAYNVDGGGSSTIVIRTEAGLQVLNSPSDGRERSDGNCILIVSLDPNYETKASEITSSTAKVTVSTDVDEYKGYQTYLLMDNEFYQTTNGTVEFSGLIHNNVYNYQVYYKGDNGNMYKTLTVGSFTTAKSNFIYLGTTIEETEDAYIIKLYYSDIDKCSNISEASVQVHSLTSNCKNGTITLNKNVFGDDIEEGLLLSFWYLLDGQNIKVDINYSDCFIYNK